MAVEDAVCVQFSDHIEDHIKAIFERFAKAESASSAAATASLRRDRHEIARGATKHVRTLTVLEPNPGSGARLDPVGRMPRRDNCSSQLDFEVGRDLSE